MLLGWRRSQAIRQAEARRALLQRRRRICDRDMRWRSEQKNQQWSLRIRYRKVAGANLGGHRITGLVSTAFFRGGGGIPQFSGVAVHPATYPSQSLDSSAHASNIIRTGVAW
jgi:hypothetical protein